ncbi:MAG TPA: hypothetical protein VHR88_10815 [Solirubrobacteraceae bacterium]|nr:hypothetical protein [Solirubrobacteraceae bacterium]
MLKRRTSIIILSLVALLVPSALAQAKPEIGIQDEDVFVSGKSMLGPTQGYQRLAELGIHPMRILVTSDSVETPGSGFDYPPVRSGRQPGGAERRARAVHARRPAPASEHPRLRPVRRGDRGPLPRPGRSVRDLERAELHRVAEAAQPRARPVPEDLLGRLQGDQGQ